MGVCVCVSVRHKNFFSLKSPWNHPLTTGVDPRGRPRVTPAHAAPPEELEYAREAGIFYCIYIVHLIVNSSPIFLQVNHFQKHRFTAETHFFGQSGLRTGGSLWVISDIHKVRTNPEVRIAGMGG